MSDHTPRDHRPAPPPSLADHLRAAVLDWVEACGRDDFTVAEVEAAFEQALRDSLAAGEPAEGPAS